MPAHKCVSPLNSEYESLALIALAMMMMLNTKPYIPRTPAIATGIMPLIVMLGFLLAPRHSPTPACDVPYAAPKPMESVRDSIGEKRATDKKE